MALCYIFNDSTNAATNLTFLDYMALLSSSPVIEAYKPVTIDIESQSQTPFLRLRHWHCRYGLLTCVRTILTTFTILLCTMITMDVVNFFIFKRYSCATYNYGRIISYPIIKADMCRGGLII